MGAPNWNRITPNGRPFDYVDPSVKPLTEEIESLTKENVLLKKENEQLRELLEGNKKK